MSSDHFGAEFFRIHSKITCREPTEPAGKISANKVIILLLYSHLFAGILIRHHLFWPIFNRSSTRNAPDFAFWGLIRVRFAVFVLFWPTKSWGLFLCRLPHGVHRLKSLVMPVRREVSVFVFTSHKNLAKTYLSRTCIEKVFLSIYITSSCYIIKTTVEHSQRNIWHIFKR